jgi:hypothetical protein
MRRVATSADALLWWGHCWTEPTELWDRAEWDDGDDYGETDWWERYAERSGAPREESLDWDNRAITLADASGCAPGLHVQEGVPLPFVAVVASQVETWPGRPVPLGSMVVNPEWPAMLEAFCRVMGITPPEDQKPGWWLASKIAYRTEEE